MFESIIRIIKEQKSLLIVIVAGFIAIGAMVGFFRKEKVRLVEINPKIIYRERILSDIAQQKKQPDASPVENLMKSEEETELFSPKETPKEAPKQNNIPEIQKTPMEDLIEVPKE
jgi:hypothetical protein